jgi:transaldolase
MIMDRLNNLYFEFGQSPWLDNLKRSYITSGTLDELVSRGIRGLTSNPTIFQKAIQGSPDYDEQFTELAALNRPILDDYWSMVLADIDGALDAFADVYHDSDGIDGYVSVEVSPALAHDGPGTAEAARDLHQQINRPNVMVKIPGTSECLPAIQQMIAEGRNINVTLIFSLERYAEVIEAYIAGLEELAADTDGSLAHVASVASFFISRVDTEIDARLDSIGTPEALALRGKAAVAQAKLAYQLFEEAFSTQRWQQLADRGARVQRPLWASTSVKNPAYPDTLYVDELIGPNTVNTLPDATIEAFADHGNLDRRIDADLADARSAWRELAEVGIDLDDVAAKLERDGVASFQKSFDELIDALETKAAALRAQH